MAEVAWSDAVAPLVLALDIGTSSLRAMVLDRRGREVAGLVARVEYQVTTGDDGRAELDPEALLAATEGALDGVHRGLAALDGTVAAVAVDTLASSVCGLGRDGVPITPLYLWSDTRPSEDASALRREVDERAAHDRTGCPIHPAYLPARIRWLRREEPRLVRALSRWASFGELLELRLFGQARVSLSIASWSGLLDRRRLTWDAEWLRILELDEAQLSPLVDRDQPLSGLAAEFARRWPRFEAVPWFPAIGDGAAANVGSDCLGPNRVALTVGTSGAMRLALDGPVEQIPWGLWAYRVDRGRTLLGGALSEGGNVHAWLTQTLRLTEPDALEAEVAALEPDGHGLTVLPFLAGERSPGWASGARGAVVGLTLATAPAEILRAALEAVAYRFALLDRLLDAYGDPERLVVVSGGALLHSPTWVQILADVLGRRLVKGIAEATARGVARLALQALGALPLEREAEQVDGDPVEPDPARHARYGKAIARQVGLYRLLVQRDADLQRRPAWDESG